MAYFDANATTPLSPAAREAWLKAQEIAWENPSSPYRSGARVFNLLENARTRLATLLNCEPKQILFNSGATEGANSVLHFIASQNSTQNPPILLSPFEHSSIHASAKRFFHQNIVETNATPGGLCTPSEISSLLTKRKPALLAVMAANNETGVIQPWPEIADIARKTDTPFLCDAAQWLGKLPPENLAESGFIIASAHKFGGPKGCGFLIIPKSATGFLAQAGGEQENGMRGGTENYPAIAAMVAALSESSERAAIPEQISRRTDWRNRFESRLIQEIPGTEIVGAQSNRLWNTVFLIPPNGTNDRWVRLLDRAGFEISTGSACSSRKNEPSKSLAALGYSPEQSRRAIRISSTWETSESEWEKLADAFSAAAAEIGSGPALAEVIDL